MNYHRLCCASVQQLKDKQFRSSDPTAILTSSGLVSEEIWDISALAYNSPKKVIVWPHVAATPKLVTNQNECFQGPFLLLEILNYLYYVNKVHLGHLNCLLVV